MMQLKQGTIKYLICFGIACLITVAVFATKGFFTDSPAVNIQILADGFSVSGLLFTLFSGLLYISGEGAFLGIGFVIRNALLTFLPFGRLKHETYAKYRERKLSEAKQKSTDRCVLVTGAIFLTIGIILTAIWYFNFYQMPV